MNEESRRVLIVGSDSEFRAAVRGCLLAFDVQEAADVVTTTAMAVTRDPDLIILEAMSPYDGLDVVTPLRKDFRTSFVPILFVISAPPIDPALRAVFSGADDFIEYPFTKNGLITRVEIALRRAASMRVLNPLTGLPGNTVIGEEIARRLRERSSFACLYVDIDNFKAYNDRYGFTKGDDVIRALAECVVTALGDEAPDECFAGHVGGDDFVVLTPLSLAEPVARRITKAFDERVGDLYEPDERRWGRVEITDRRGNVMRVPLCSVSIGIVHTRRTFETAAQMAQVAAEMKGVAKRQPGSSWAVDRRST